MIYIGNHVSVSAGYAGMGKEELKLGGSTFAFFLRNPRGGKAKDAAEEDIDGLRKLLTENSFGPLVAHGAYTMNICAAKEEVRTKAEGLFYDDLLRMQALPGNYYNFHPGCHVGQGTEEGIRIISATVRDAIDRVRSETGDFRTKVLLETMAGKGSEIGGTFEELRRLLDGIDLPEDTEVCLDTCHVWDGGYDIREHLDDVLEEFDRVIGLDRLFAIHLNDSKNVLASHKDRHEKLGEGALGEEALKAVVQHPALQGRPFILETPNDDEGYKKEIAQVRGWMRM
ncbi:MAG: deoxyribonuclease IV [Eubacterium sp.]|nr:deoxyribonuclease IV [Eubacterium sp.]